MSNLSQFAWIVVRCMWQAHAYGPGLRCVLADVRLTFVTPTPRQATLHSPLPVASLNDGCLSSLVKDGDSFASALTVA